MSASAAPPAAPHVNFSKFATADSPTVQVPMSVINRPLPSELDQAKVERFMEGIKVRPTRLPVRTAPPRLIQARMQS